MPKALLSAVAVFISFIAVTPTAFADSVAPDSVSGTLDFYNGGITTPNPLYNAFNPLTTPGGYSQKMNASFSDQRNNTGDTAVFDGTYLTITAPQSQANFSPYLMTFADSNFTSVTLFSSTYADISYGFSNGTLTFNSYGAPAGTQQVVFQYTDSADTPAPPDMAATPEPSSLMLLGTGMASLAGFARLRSRK